MEEKKIGDEVRAFQNGKWYWVPKAVIERHFPAIGARGLAVYNLLAALADRNQSCYPSQKYMAKRLGCARSTVNKAVKVLALAGLVRIKKRDRYRLVYSLLKVRCRPGETQMSPGGNPDVRQPDTNDNKRTINNNDIDMKKNGLSVRTGREGFNPQTREELLALDLAEGLNDLKSLPLYLAYARKYPEGALRRTLSEVRAVPDSRIKKSRGALFNHLMQKYG